MKIVTINDAVFVGETLNKYLPDEFEKQHIQRSRGLWDKTFGIASKILKSKGDVYHSHYLLQDCYIASKLGKKPLLGHAHGSDLRTALTHNFLSRIVRHNLSNCDKILVSTPDILNIAKQVRKDAEYLPNPVDYELFYPKSLLKKDKKRRVLIASNSNWSVKGTDIAIQALNKIKNEVDVSIIAYGKDFEKTKMLASSLGLNLKILPKSPHKKLNKYYWDADVVIDRFAIGSLGMVSLEAIACGRPVISWVSSEYPENKDFPLRDLRDEEAIAKTIIDLPSDLWETEYCFLKKHHHIKKIESRLIEIYNELLKNK
ncbi:glycosyltransferase family 4 protein [Candidatus Bathyarchaeota archaeon]|nr:glycosyltransferase family 4 protein [Candidatus Bathyarchaeota archaeon]